MVVLPATTTPPIGKAYAPVLAANTKELHRALIKKRGNFAEFDLTHEAAVRLAQTFSATATNVLVLVFQMDLWMRFMCVLPCSGGGV